MKLLVHDPGLMTTVQDLGRFGFLDRGVPPSGALDPDLLAIANTLAGNQAGSPCLEMIGRGPRLEVQAQSVRIGLAGNLRLRIDGEDQPSWRSYRLKKGQSVEIGAITGMRAGYLALCCGFDLPKVLGSRSAYVPAGLGIRLEAGMALPLAADMASGGMERILPTPSLQAPKHLRVIPGPEDQAFTLEARHQFFESAWRVTGLSDRMGLRLDGPKLAHQKGPDIPTGGVVKGCIQVPGDGQPILLLNDHQTTGGYARIATVISADLPAAGRLMPGHELHFFAVSWAEAKGALIAAKTGRAALLNSIRPLNKIDLEALLSANLVSGAVDALDQDITS